MAGALLPLFITPPKSIVATILAFGSGVLVPALSFSLVEEAFRLTKDVLPVIVGFVIGGISYTTANFILSRKSDEITKHRKRSHYTNVQDNSNNKGQGLTLLVGSVMDNIPENIALGISFVFGGTVNFVLITAIIISNFPEGLASSHGMRSNGKSRRYILTLWSAAVLIGTLSAGLGYSVLSNTSPTTIGITTSFAAGAILAMLAESMMPKAFEQGGSKIGLATVAGFATAFTLGTLG